MMFWYIKIFKNNVTNTVNMSILKYVMNKGYARIEIMTEKKASIICEKIDNGIIGFDHIVYKSLQNIFSDVYQCSPKFVIPHIDKIVKFRHGCDDSIYKLYPKSDEKLDYRGYLSLNNSDSRFVCWPSTHLNKNQICTIENAKYLDVKAGVFIIWDTRLINCLLPPSKCIPSTMIQISGIKK